MPKLIYRTGLSLLLAVSVTAVFLFSVLTSAFANEKVIRLGVPIEAYPPYLMLDGDNVTGILADAIIQIANDLGYSVHTSILPRKRLNLAISQGKIDAIAGAIEWGDAPNGEQSTDGIIRVADNLISNDPKQTTASPQDLIGKRIVVMEGFGYPTIDPLIKSEKVQVDRTVNFARLLMMTDKGRVDYAVLDENVARWVIRSENLEVSDNLTFARPGFDEVEYRIILFNTHDWGPFIIQFNKALAIFKASPRWTEVLNQYR